MSYSLKNRKSSIKNVKTLTYIKKHLKKKKLPSELPKHLKALAKSQPFESSKGLPDSAIVLAERLRSAKSPGEAREEVFLWIFHGFNGFSMVLYDGFSMVLYDGCSMILIACSMVFLGFSGVLLYSISAFG